MTSSEINNEFPNGSSHIESLNVLPPIKNRHERKSFATPTLKLITSRLQYYRRVLKEPISDDPIKIRQRERIQRKYDYNMKVRKLLNRAVANRYI